MLYVALDFQMNFLTASKKEKKYMPSAPKPKREYGFTQRLNSLFRIDCIRVSRILETVQYSIIFSLLALFIGFAIDWIFEPLYKPPSKSDKTCSHLKVLTIPEALQNVFVIVLQASLCATSVIYIRKIANLVPFGLSPCPDKYIPNWGVKEDEGELAIGLVFIGMQTSLIDNLVKLRNTFAPAQECSEDA